MSPLPSHRDGEPSPAVLTQAAEWFVLLASGEASEDDRCRWHAWRNAHPAHEKAWQRAEATVARLADIPSGQAGASSQALRLPPAGKRRRRFVAQLAILLVGSSTGWLAYRESDLSASAITAVGELRSVQLADGGQLQLDTDTAVDIEYSAKTRLLRLRRGRILIETAPDPANRPFMVETADGRATALGTRFTVEQDKEGSRVVVLEKKVAVHGYREGAANFIVAAGESVRFDRDGIRLHSIALAADSAWSQGMLIADDMRLADFVAQLARYRRPTLTCAADAANLRISGAFPLHDSEHILAALSETLPVRLVRDESGERLEARGG